MDQVIKFEQTYIEETLSAEKQRRNTENVLRRGVERLETVERQRLAHCQTALGRFQRKVAQLGPNLNLVSCFCKKIYTFFRKKNTIFSSQILFKKKPNFRILYTINAYNSIAYLNWKIRIFFFYYPSIHFLS